MNKMKTELDDYSHIVDTMRGNIVDLCRRCEQLDKELQDALTTNTMILEGREAETEQGIQHFKRTIVLLWLGNCKKKKTIKYSQRQKENA